MRLPGARKSELADVDDRGVAAAAHHWHAGHALHHVHQAGNWAVGLDAGRATTAVVVGAGDVLGEGAAGRPPRTHGASAGRRRRRCLLYTSDAADEADSVDL